MQLSRTGIATSVACVLICLGLIVSSQLLSFCRAPTSEILSVLRAKSMFHDCDESPQGWPVFANKVGGVAHKFFVSVQDLGADTGKFQAMQEGKLFGPVGVSNVIQKVLRHLHSRDVMGAVVDVGANIGWASFAAAAMGAEVFAFEPVVENVNKLCDGIHLNRVTGLVKVVHAAVSDSPGKATLHKVEGRFDNTAVSRSGATANIRAAGVVPFQIETVTVDSVVGRDVKVALVKIDVQGWELHVVRGARELLSRPREDAPYVMYEEDERLLKASNTSSEEIASFLEGVGYSSSRCVRVGGDRHCSKRSEDLAWIK